MVYGYPVLGLALLLGAVGVPVPSGLTAAAAGALAAQGYLAVGQAAAVAMAGLLAGDLVGYGLGWWAGRELVERHSRWFGLSHNGMARASKLFDRWGGLSIVVTSSLMTVLSTPVNLLAGASRYRMRKYLPFDFVGRLAWTAGYLGAGFAFSESVEDVATFLGDASGFIGSVLVVIALIAVAVRWRKRLF
jgi:membrane-associated protein